MKIAVLGTGIMGSGFAEGLMNAGHDVIVYNRTIDKTAPLVALGAKSVETPSEAIMAADAAILVLSDGKAVRNTLLNDQTKAVLKGKKIINASTTNPDEIIEMAHEVAENGGDLAEISILCGAEQLREKQGQFLMGCDAEVEDFWVGVLSMDAGVVQRVGEVGDASKAEAPMLLGSMFVSATVAYSAAVAMKLNVPQEIITGQVSMFAPGAEYFLPNMFARDYSQCMASVNSFRDVAAAAISTTKSLGVPTKVLEDLLELFESAAERGYGDQDGSAILEVLLESK